MARRKRRKKSFIEKMIDGIVKGSVSEPKRIHDSVWPEFAYIGKKKKK